VGKSYAATNLGSMEKFVRKTRKVIGEASKQLKR